MEHAGNDPLNPTVQTHTCNPQLERLPRLIVAL